MPEPRILLANVIGVGDIRYAPGTWGSVVAACVALVVAIALPGGWLPWAFLSLAGLATVVGLLAVPVAQDHYGSLDPGQVVIDEVAGLWLALAVIPGGWLEARPLLGVLAALLLFRALDIAKPWPVSMVERIPGAWGVMLDDLVAGLAAGIACLPLMA